LYLNYLQDKYAILVWNNNYAPAAICINIVQPIAAIVPTAYPNTAKRTPTVANDGWNAEATIGADAAPPTLAWLPTARKKYGAFIILATINNNLKNIKIKWKTESACTIVLASQGYPGKYEKNKIITGLDHKVDNVKIFHSGTKIINDQFVTNGGRVLAVTALGVNLQVAQAKAYDRCNQISWEGKIKRHDIADKEINNKFIFS